MRLEFKRRDGLLLCEAEIVASKELIHNVPTLIELSQAESVRLGEPRIQLLEGCGYEYALKSPKYHLQEAAPILYRSRLGAGSFDRGLLNTSLYVGTLHLSILGETGQVEGSAAVEVRSRKLEYRSEFREMLEDITEWAAGLVSKVSAITEGRFELKSGVDNKTLVERYFLLRSILSGRSFSQAISRIQAAPHSVLISLPTEGDVRRGAKPTASTQREIASKQRRIPIPLNHKLRTLGVDSVPEKITIGLKQISVDTPENRFVRHLLETARNLISRIADRFEGGLTPQSSANEFATLKDMRGLYEELDLILIREPFRSCSRLRHLNIGSPVLQQKAGYREMLRFWLMLQMASQLGWAGGEYVFSGGRKDIAVLYEYWCFIKVLQVLAKVARLPVKYGDRFITVGPGGLEVRLARGTQTDLLGSVSTEGRELSVELSFNRTFRHSADKLAVGSWTRDLRPDITITLWPANLQRGEAERYGLTARIHFDAKYKSVLTSLLVDPEYGEEEQIYGRDDLAKMHAYRDAIRRSEGAYILYPGSKMTVFQCYDEILPGLGAIALRPGNASGIANLSSLITRMIINCANQASQREALGYAVHSVVVEKSEPHAAFVLPDLAPTVRSPSEEPVITRADPRHRRVAMCRLEKSKRIERRGEDFYISTGLDEGGIKAVIFGLTDLFIFVYGPEQIEKLMRILDVKVNIGDGVDLFYLELRLDDLPLAPDKILIGHLHELSLLDSRTFWLASV